MSNKHSLNTYYVESIRSSSDGTLSTSSTICLRWLSQKKGKRKEKKAFGELLQIMHQVWKMTRLILMSAKNKGDFVEEVTSVLTLKQEGSLNRWGKESTRRKSNVLSVFVLHAVVENLI